jgi:hypothetical protein
MPATPPATPAAKASEIDSLRQQLTEADRKRRALVFELFLKHGGDSRVILETLFADASRLTLDKIEVLLDLEGGES